MAFVQVCVYMSVVPMEARKGIRSAEVGLIGSYELPGMWAKLMAFAR